MSDDRLSSPQNADESISQEFAKLISGAQQFLMQEQDLFGNIIYPSSEHMSGKKGADREGDTSPYPPEPWAAAESLRSVEHIDL